jgi:hypothetical protein
MGQKIRGGSGTGIGDKVAPVIEEFLVPGSEREVEG